MQLSTTFRHMDASQAVREYAAEKLDKIRKYFNKDPISAHAVFSVERGFHHVADLNITLPSGIVINAQGDDRGHVLLDRSRRGAHRAAGAQVEGQDSRPQAARRAVDLGARDGHHRRGGRAAAAARGRREPDGAGGARPPAPGYNVIKDERFTARSMTVEDAVMQLNLLGDELLVFTDATQRPHRRPLPAQGRQLRAHRDRGPALRREPGRPLIRPALPMRVIDFLRPDCIIATLQAKTKPAVLAELSAHLAKVVPGVEAEALRKVLEEREQLASTAIGDGIAIPHGKLDSVGRLVGRLGRAVDGHRVRVDRRQADQPGVHAGRARQLDRACTSRRWPGCRGCFATPTSASGCSTRRPARPCTRSSSRKTPSTRRLLESAAWQRAHSDVF